MEANFQRCLAVTLKQEGGWSDRVDDPGGATMKGVTLKTFRRYKPGATKADLKAISDEMLATIYRDGYWRTVSGDDLPAGVDLACFDFGVNSGPGRAVKYLQHIAGCKVDGVIGPVTLKAVAALEPSFIIGQICDDRLAFLHGLGSWKSFGNGWSNRVEAIRTAAIQMAAQPTPDNPPAGAPVRPAASPRATVAVAGIAAVVAVAVAWGEGLLHAALHLIGF